MLLSTGERRKKAAALGGGAFRSLGNEPPPGFADRREAIPSGAATKVLGNRSMPLNNAKGYSAQGEEVNGIKTSYLGIMKKTLMPFLSIAVATVLLVAANELTEWGFIREYAFVVIVAAMFFGLWFQKRITHKSGQKAE